MSPWNVNLYQWWCVSMCIHVHKDLSYPLTSAFGRSEKNFGVLCMRSTMVRIFGWSSKCPNSVKPLSHMYSIPYRIALVRAKRPSIVCDDRSCSCKALVGIRIGLLLVRCNSIICGSPLHVLHIGLWSRSSKYSHYRTYFTCAWCTLVGSTRCAKGHN